MYNMSMRMIADAIIDTFGPSPRKVTLQVEPAIPDLSSSIPFADSGAMMDSLDLDPIPIDSKADDSLAIQSFADPLDYFLLCANEETGSNENDAQEVRTDGVDLTSNKKFKSHRTMPRPAKAPRIRAKRRAFPKAKNNIALKCRKNDVLLGRGGHASNNPGNSFLLLAVRTRQDEYKSLGKTKQDIIQKRAIVQQIVSMAESQGSRFLYREKKGEQWREASSRAVYEKISHMLRD